MPEGCDMFKFPNRLVFAYCWVFNGALNRDSRELSYAEAPVFTAVVGYDDCMNSNEVGLAY